MEFSPVRARVSFLHTRREGLTDEQWAIPASLIPVAPRPHASTCFRRFSRRLKAGVMGEILEALASIKRLRRRAPNYLRRITPSDGGGRSSGFAWLNKYKRVMLDGIAVPSVLPRSCICLFL